MLNYLKDLQHLITINSKTLNELGEINVEGINESSYFVKDLLIDLPLDWEIIQREGAADFLIAKTKEVDSNLPQILLSGHVDTVFSSQDVELKETEDKLYGSGAQDMKGGVIIIVEVLKELHKLGNLKNIKFAISPEEELGRPMYWDIFEDLAKKADYILVFESTLDIEPNAKLNKRSVVVSRRGFQQFDLTIKGPGGHSGVIFKKEDRKSTILLASEIIQKLEALADYEKQTTLNCGLIKGGEAINVIAPETKLSFETRFKTRQECERVVSEVRKLVKEYSLKKDFELVLVENRFYPPLQRNENAQDFVELCQKVASNLGLELIIEERAGGSEASLFQHFNPKAKVLDGFGVRGDGQHTKNEFVYKESIFSTIEYAARVVKYILEFRAR